MDTSHCDTYTFFPFMPLFRTYFILLSLCTFRLTISRHVRCMPAHCVYKLCTSSQLPQQFAQPNHCQGEPLSLPTINLHSVYLLYIYLASSRCVYICPSSLRSCILGIHSSPLARVVSEQKKKVPMGPWRSKFCTVFAQSKSLTVRFWPKISCPQDIQLLEFDFFMYIQVHHVIDIS